MGKVKKQLFLSVLFMIVAIYFVFTNVKTEKTITYFPINENESFSKTSTMLIPSEEESKVQWLSESISDKKLYLRQDVSLLFINGYLAGILNKWIEQTDTIQQAKQFYIEKDAQIETVSFHHGELHENDTITSIQEMTKDQLYFINNKFLKPPKSEREKRKAESLNKTKQKQLQHSWNELIDHFQINKKNYIDIPLTDINRLQDYLSKNATEKEKEQLIGQLWEGLYKNYILLAVETKSTDIMPIILLAKDRTHLHVLFKIDDKKHQLLQRIHLTP